MDTPYRLNILGAEVDLVTPSCVMDFLKEGVASGRRTVLANHNLHSLYLFKKHAEMRAFYEKADLIEIDSMPMVAWGKLMGLPVSAVHRCTYLDYREDFWALAEAEKWRVYHIGGASENNDLSRAAILKRYPNVHLDIHTGFFDLDSAKDEALIVDLNAKAPHILLVGMGMPRQETWIQRNYDRLPNCVILSVGAALDYEAGVMYTPPRWTGRLGIEWLVRFIHEPQRLFERYFIEPWHLLPQFAHDLMRRLAGRSAMVPRSPVFGEEPQKPLARPALRAITSAPEMTEAEPEAAPALAQRSV